MIFLVILNFSDQQILINQQVVSVHLKFGLGGKCAPLILNVE